MKRILFSMFVSMASLLNMEAYAVEVCEKSDKIPVSDDDFFQPLKPLYHNNVFVSSWADNWFVSVSGGAAAFIGSPIGCDDLFGRLKPALQVSLGKWHTPSVGNRIVFQGFEWKSGTLESQQYRHYHADFLWNLIPSFNIGKNDCRWDVIPLVGLGLVDNRDANTRPFAVNYGILGRYRLAKGLHITAEISDVTTFKDADGIGNGRKMGDHLLSVSAGVSWTFGKHRGWQKVIDARPFMTQNERLIAYAYEQKKENERLSRMNSINAQLVMELRKILDIEGLLDKYAEQLKTSDDLLAMKKGNYPVNDYSGLNSLRKRLRQGGRKTDEKEKNITEGIPAKTDSTIVSDIPNYRELSKNGNECLGAPIYFFFELGTASLVDKSQCVNLDEIARIAQKYNLKIEVTGAADSATGTEYLNSNLGRQRADFIAAYLQKKGVPIENIETTSKGGISDYSPNEANRNAIVCLFLP